MTKNINSATSALDAATPDVEYELRKELWLHHGHEGLYGDDGEMQCCKCRPLSYDYKRAPIDQIINYVGQLRLERLATSAITARRHAKVSNYAYQ